ncbi:MAG: DUF4127 family protein [Chitinophagaceae bacterium]
MKKLITLAIVFFAMIPALAQIHSSPSVKILFVPLDDRPPCLQFTRQMGLIGDAHIVTPPKEFLGRFTTPGESDKIISWLKQQDLRSFNAAIISLDMVVYGGLVGSRAHHVETGLALQRIEVIREIHKKAPGLRLYVQNVIMRLAPTADGKNEAYRAALAKWAEISVNSDDKSKAETSILASSIPAKALASYRMARLRNVQINLKAVQFVQSGIIDFLILSQDDAKPIGIHVAERLKLVAAIKKAGLTNKIAVQPGADEVSMLLLARALNQHYRFLPKIKPVYSSAVAANNVMPFEDKPLKETVSYHIKATGSQEVENENQADLLFYVFASRHETGRAASFAAEIEDRVRQGNRVIVADIDPVGNVQGGDSAFTNELGRRGLFPELNGYASWNTAANTIGTTLPQGIIFILSERKLLNNKAIADRIWTAQNWFTFHRILDDYYFHGLERLNLNKHFGQDKLSSKILDDSTNKQVENYATELLLKSFNELSNLYAHKMATSRQKNVSCQQPSNMNFKLPWNRTFEAEINFDMQCSLNR